MWPVRWCREAVDELDALSARERIAVESVVKKLEALGPTLPFPHQSLVMGENHGGVRELRPRGGRSATRPFFQRVGNEFIIGAVGPEAGADAKGFRRAVDRAGKRITGLATGEWDEIGE